MNYKDSEYTEKPTQGTVQQQTLLRTQSGETVFRTREKKHLQQEIQRTIKLLSKKIKLFKTSYLPGFTNMFIENINSKVERHK